MFSKSIGKANDKGSITNLWLPACLVVLLFLGALPGVSVADDTGIVGTWSGEWISWEGEGVTNNCVFRPNGSVTASWEEPLELWDLGSGTVTVTVSGTYTYSSVSGLEMENLKGTVTLAQYWVEVDLSAYGNKTDDNTLTGIFYCTYDIYESGEFVWTDYSGGTYTITRPSLTTSKSVYKPNEVIVVNFSGAEGNANDWIGLFSSGSDTLFAWVCTDNTRIGTPGKINGTVTFWAPSTPDDYEVRLFFNGSWDVAATAQFGVKIPASITMSTSDYPMGEIIVVNFSGAEGNANDWIGLFPSGSDALLDGYWCFTDNTHDGTAGITNGTVTFWGPPAPGDYEARLFFNGSWYVEASAQFSVVGTPPTITTSKSDYQLGEVIVVNFSGVAGNAHDWIGLFPKNGGNNDYLDWVCTDNTHIGTAGIIDGTVTFWGLSTPGEYEVRLFSNGSREEKATAQFNVVTPPAITTSKPVYKPDEVIVVDFSDAAGNANDWIGLFPKGGDNNSYLAWVCTDNTQIGTAGKINGAVTFWGPSTPGNYEVRLFFNGSREEEATASFSVEAPASITTNKSVYQPGEVIVVDFSGAEENANDWIGLFPKGGDNNAYLAWVCTDNTHIGTPGIIDSTVTFWAPSTSGDYEVRLFFNGSRNVEATNQFRVQLLKAYNPSPSDGAAYTESWATLSWMSGDTAVSHNVYFGDNFDKVDTGTGGTFQGNQAEMYFDAGLPGGPYPDGFTPGTTYYWRIDEVEADGTTIHKGDVWGFMFIPLPIVETETRGF